jgi:hypothetical protein
MIFVTNFHNSGELLMKVEEEMVKQKRVELGFLRVPLNNPNSLTDELATRQNIMVILSGDVETSWLNGFQKKSGGRKIIAILDPETKSPHLNRELHLLAGIEIIQRFLNIEQIIAQVNLLLKSDSQNVTN